jgi:outer membrane protein OmpA-like peptidoglycan-associated protein
VLTVFSAVLAFSITADAVAGPMRPTTFVVDTRLSEGPVENFSALLVNPNKLAAHLKPLDSAEGLVPKATVTDDQIAINDRIFFAPGTNGIRPSSFPILDRVAFTLIARPDIEEISIQGHAARNPNGDVNLALSVQRSKAVVDYLVTKGVNASRITSIGFGQTRPEEDSESRVEFVIEKWGNNRLSSDARPPADASKGEGTGSLLISNDHSYEATVAVNGTVVGTVGPYTHAALHGLKSGLYDVRFSHTSGYSYFQAVRTGKVDSPIVPGGAPAATVLKNGGLPAAKAAE